MALITRGCSSHGASVIFTINDLTQRVTLAEIITVARQMRIVMFDDQGAIAQEVSPLLNTTISVVMNIPVRLVEITKADTSIKSYLSPPFAVFF